MFGVFFLSSIIWWEGDWKFGWRSLLELWANFWLVGGDSPHLPYRRNPDNFVQYIYIYISTYNIYVYTYAYGIHHWRILWSSYRKLAWVGFEPTTTEFRSEALTDRAIRPWVQLTLRANFVQPLQFHGLFSVTFHFGYCLHQLPRLFSSNFLLR